MTSRQWSKARRWVIGWITLVLLIIGTASYFIVTSGPSFFVFRENGTGSTVGGPTDQQYLQRQARQAVHEIHCKELPFDNIVCVEVGQ